MCFWRACAHVCVYVYEQICVCMCMYYYIHVHTHEHTYKHSLPIQAKHTRSLSGSFRPEKMNKTQGKEPAILTFIIKLDIILILHSS